MIQFPTEFREFLKLLNAHRVKYLVVGGYAVSYYGYPRTTADIDFWIERSRRNAERVVNSLAEFGFDVPELEPDLFLEERRIVRMGHEPLRIEIMMSISGVEFDECYPKRTKDVIDNVEVQFIGLDCLKRNKRASGRHRDLDDLENLP